MGEMGKRSHSGERSTLRTIPEQVDAFRRVREAHRHELIDDYLELIADLTEELGEVRQVDITARLGVAQPTVAKMLKRLSHAGLIDQAPYQGVNLTPKGKQLADISRVRHQIVERFLLALGVSPAVARRDAEGLEHHVSDETLSLFKKFSEKNS